MNRRFYRLAVGTVAASTCIVFTISSDPVSPDTHDSSDPDVSAIYDRFDTLLTDLSEYAWPVDPLLSTTSVFADFRSTHFHAGVDVSTRGKEGYEVRAMRDGYVSLVRVAPNGYGKALQITHEDGFTTWHAHLSRYAADIEAAVRRLQHQRGRYPVTLHPSAKSFPVRRGDVIAYTGSTGAGEAHLHFEIRDQNGNPLDPLLSESFLGMAEDDDAPVIEEVGFHPLEALTFVQGDTRPVYLRPIRRGQRRYSMNTVVHTTGLLGLTVKVRDGVGRRSYRNRGVSLRLEVDSVVVFESNISRLPWGDGKQIALHYDWAARGAGKSHHQKMYVETGNRLPFYHRMPPGSGMLLSSSFERGYHSYRISAADVHGNTTVATGYLVFNHPPEISVASGPDGIVVTSEDPTVRNILVTVNPVDGSAPRSITYGKESRAGDLPSAWRIPYPTTPYEALNVVAENEFGTQSAGHWIPSDERKQSNTSLAVETSFSRSYAYVSVSSSLPITGRPRIKVYSGNLEADLSVRSLTSKRFFSSFSLDLYDNTPIRVEAIAEVNGTPQVLGYDHFTVHPVSRESGGVVTSSDGSLRLVFPPNAVFDRMFLRLQKEGTGYDVQPDDILLDRGATVELDRPKGLEKDRAGLFATRGGEMDLLDWKGPGEKGSFRGRVTRFLGSFEILEDATGPTVSKLTYAYRAGRLTGSFRIHDSRAGVNASSIRVSVDGAMVIPEFESEKHRVTLNEPLRLQKGKHSLIIEASDRMGNATRYSRSFTTR